MLSTTRSETQANNRHVQATQASVGVGCVLARPLRWSRRVALLVSVSAAALVAHTGAHARSLQGGSASPAANAAGAAEVAAIAQAQSAARHASSALSRARQSMEALQAAQAAARNLALQAPTLVPNGLTAGGLVVAPGAGSVPGVWTGAQLPTQARGDGRTQVEIKQTEAKAILNWEQFNVGRETTVYFNQTAGNTVANPTGASTWIALNRVNDPSGRPSRILGQIRADGQVYVINRNGIVFGGASQVNVNTFVASSLALSDEQFRLGINNPLKIAQTGFNDYAIPQFGESAPGGGLGTPFIAGAASGDVRVEAGARIETASGGKLMLFGPKVMNAGQLDAVDGQIILAAGEQVWLAPDPHGVRGFDVAVSAPAARLFNYADLKGALGLGTIFDSFAPLLRDVYMPEMEARAAAVGYNVTNRGIVQSERGNITLQSRQVEQAGTLLATSALNNREGSIRLRAWGQGVQAYSSELDYAQLAHWSAGTLTLRPDSVTTVMPDVTDTSEIEQSALATRYKPGNIELRGKLIDIQSFASAIVPSGTISAIAGTLPISNAGSPAAGPTREPVSDETSDGDGSRVYIDRGALLSVAGVQDVLVPMSRNFVEAELRINELRDSPLYRDSWLRGAKVIVDRRVTGTFTSGPMAGVQWVQDKEGNFQAGSWVGSPLADFSGWIGVGKTDLQELSTVAGKIYLKAGGDVITRAGSLLDVSGGSVRYSDGWNNVTKLLGADGRIHDIGKASSDMIYVGLAQGFRRDHGRWGVTEIWKSVFDRGNDRFERGYSEGRAAGEIRIFGVEAMVLEGDYWGGVINGERQLQGDDIAAAGQLKIGSGSDPDRPWSYADLIITDRPMLLPAGFDAMTAVGETFARPVSGSGPRKSGWLDAGVLGNSGLGKIELYVTNSFKLEAGTTLELSPRTSFSVTSNASVSSDNAFAIDGTVRSAGGTIAFGTAGAGLRTLKLGAGAMIDVAGQWVNELTNGISTTPVVIDGGTVSLSAATMMAEAGVVLDVSGGGLVKRERGTSGLVSGNAGAIKLPSITGDQLANLDLRAFALGSGGSLTIETSSSIQIGGAAPVDPTTLHLPATLYAERGFRSLTLQSFGGDVVVPDGTLISQIPLTVMPARNYYTQGSGSRITDIGELGLLPVDIRTTIKPTEFKLSASGDILIGRGATIRTDIAGQIAMTTVGAGGGDLKVYGTIEAPAGTIALDSVGTLQLAVGASLIARGAPVIAVDGRGRHSGEVLPGGEVTAKAGRSLQLDPGSLIDVSGASGAIDIPSPTGFSTRGSSSVLNLASNGGRIALTAGSLGAVIDAALLAGSGGQGGAGGTFELSESASAGGTNGFLLPTQLYWIDRATGAVRFGSLTTVDLDLYDEYGTAPIRLNGAIRNAIRDLPRVISESLLIVDGPAAGDGAGKSSLTPSEINPVLDPKVIDLLNKYFWTGTSGGPTLDTKIFVADVPVSSTRIAAGSITGGGFASVALTSQLGIRLSDGLDLALGGALTLNTPSLSNVSGGSASISAPFIRFETTRTAAASASLGGQLTLVVGVIEIARGANIRGFASSVFDTTSLLLSAPLGLNQAPVSVLDVQGKLTLKAAQVYPATGTTATVRATDQITVMRNGDAAAPLSAGGQLIVEAPIIEQLGVLRAPFGQITLKASTSLRLGAGSLTSVSGDGLVAPYGALSNGEQWIDPTKPTTSSDPTANYMIAPPEKRIILDGPVIESSAGSVIDIRGGGDLYAREFVPGPGGSHDILAMSGSYAVMPGYNGMTPAGGTGIGQQVWPAGGNGLPAGWYSLLPASYAAMPGGYLVSLAGPQSTAVMSKAQTLADGSVVMDGRRGNVLDGSTDQLSSRWRVMSGAQLRQYTEYNEAFANTYFASDAFKLTRYRLTGQQIVTPRLPIDGGAVVFKATQQLILDGTLQSQAVPGGRGGLVDIAGTRIAIVGAGKDAAALRTDGYLVIDSAQLTNFGAGSLLIGGTRVGDPLGLRLDVTASDIVIYNDGGSALVGPEIIVAASGLVDMRGGSVVIAQGSASSGAGDLVLTPQVAAVYGDPGGDDGDPSNDILLTPSKDFGALIRLSTGDAVKVIRENVDTGIGGIVTVGDGVRLDGGNALLIDATRNTELAATAAISGTSLSVGSGRISFGGGSDGLILSPQTLTQLANAQHLTLRSYTSIDFYGSVDLGGAGLKAVTLDTAGLIGYAAAPVSMRGVSIALVNSGASFTEPVGPVGSASLMLAADELVLGSGSKAIRGFTGVTLAGAIRIVGEGNGSIDAGATPLALLTPVLTGRGGAVQTITTSNALTLTGDTLVPVTGLESSLGSRFSLKGRSIDLAGRIVALGGAVDLTATGGDLVIGERALIDVGGFAKQFFDVADYADAGRIGLTAVGGNIRSEAGSLLRLAAATGGGNAGSLAVTATGGGTVALNGMLAAQAGNGGKGGAFALDIEALPGFADLGTRLNAGGFTASRQFRIRTGDVLIDGVTQVENFALVADRGQVTVTGAIDARALYGGRIAITAGNGLNMLPSATLLAGATDAELGSGRIILDAAGGQLDLRGGLIDVAGGAGGRVRLRANQNASPVGIAVGGLLTSISGAQSTVLEGVARYDVADYDGTTIDSVLADAVLHANGFTSRSTTILAAIPGGSSVTLGAGIAISSAGDLVLNGNLDLAGLSVHEGTLTLRAGGNLIINGHISDGFSAPDHSGRLLDAASWNLRLIAGADLTSADALAVRPLAGLAADTGSLVLGDTTAGKLVRTGTGDIDVRVARDLTLSNNKSAIYTAGRRDMTSWADFTSTPASAVYGVRGGHLNILAQGDISATLPINQSEYQLFTEWLWRQGEVGRDLLFLPGQQSTWWVNYAAFQQGVGALGGGNVAVNAGGDVVNLLVALPTNSRVRGGLVAGEQKVLEMRNGGAMDVTAAGSIRGGQYYIGRGAGSIAAGELAIGRTVSIIQPGGAFSLNYSVAPVLALGDATLKVRTAGDMRIQTVLDPLLVSPWRSYDGSRPVARMSGYTSRSALEIVSTGGDVTLVNDGQALFGDMNWTDPQSWSPDWRLLEETRPAMNRYPAITRVSALNGSLEIDGPLYTLAGSNAELRILVENDIRLANHNPPNLGFYPYGQIFLSRATPAMMPSPLMPFPSGNLDVIFANEDGPLEQFSYYNIDALKSYLYSVNNPERLPMADDYEPSRIYARSGSFIGERGSKVVANEQTWLRAGRDIRGVNYSLRNIRPTDVSLIEAGNDLIGAVGSYAGSVKVQGPGALVVTTNRDIYGGATAGSTGYESLSIVSTGNRMWDPNNRPILQTDLHGLPEEGAAITLIAGLNGKAPSYDAFKSAYLDPANVTAMPDYLTTTTADGARLPTYLVDVTETRKNGQQKIVQRGLVSYVAEMTGETLSPLDAWARFLTLPKLVQEVFLRRVYMQELRNAGRDQNEPGDSGLPKNGGYNRGYAAIDKLFPGVDWKGDVAAHSLTLRTMVGGDIEVMTPGGGLQVAALGAVAPAGAGLVTLGSGNIDVFARDSLTVNRSRILTFVPEATARGSDMILWSTLGDIDAGRGAKTLRVPTAPDIETDPDGVTRILERRDMSGSGIGTVGDGDLDLIAPRGTVNAGDAGIRVAGNLNLAALFVLNVANIQVGGDTKGVPKAAVAISPVAPLAERNEGSKAADDASRSGMQNAGQPSVIIVEVIGYGGGDDDERRRNQDQRRSDNSAPSYNPRGPVRILGVGPLTEEEKAALSEDEKQRL